MKSRTAGPKRSHQQTVTERLREMVLTGQLVPGEHLQEIPLADRMGVSRTPVRAALAALGQEGLLDYRPKRGHVVRRFTIDEIIDAWEVRGMLEGMACRLAAERGISPGDERVMRQALEKGDEILAVGMLTEEGHEPWRQMNDVFHGAILSAARNRTLDEATARTLNMPFASARVVYWYEYEAIKGSHNYHYDVFNAIVKGQGPRAEAMMREHIWRGIDVLREKLAEAYARLDSTYDLEKTDK